MQDFYIVNAFTGDHLLGNPAAVVPLEQWVRDEQLLTIAGQFNLSETAFVVRKASNTFHIRWFTPKVEVDLCGHATLATGYSLFVLDKSLPDQLFFESKLGTLILTKKDDHYSLDFPLDTLSSFQSDIDFESIFGASIKNMVQGKHDILLEFENEEDIRHLQPDFKRLEGLTYRGFIATSKGKTTDFVSRCFYPSCGILEDPVTGSAHTTMIAYWHDILGQKTMTATQLSSRGGILKCQWLGDRCHISGQCTLFAKGTFNWL